MAFNYSFFLYHYFILLIFTIPLFSSPVSASDQTRGVLCEEKTRLGSTPPSCYNKCNQCHPCKAVQVPTLPSLDRVEPPRTSQPPSSEFELSYWDNNRYSNYKPLGWKCRCRNNFYNP